LGQARAGKAQARKVQARKAKERKAKERKAKARKAKAGKIETATREADRGRLQERHRQRGQRDSNEPNLTSPPRKFMHVIGTRVQNRFVISN
jgi:hypothetical protein